MKTMDDKKNVTIYIASHKECFVPPLSTFCPIQVGAAKADHRIEGFAGDDTGDNISLKNPFYCELTALYWAWKNSASDHIGLFHYRRYIAMREVEKEEDNWGNIVFERPDDHALSMMGLDDKTIQDMVKQYDVITVKGRHFYLPENGKIPENVHDSYRLGKDHHIEDLDTAAKVLLEKYPEYEEDVRDYLHGTTSYECNMFIMRRDILDSYASWLFDILFETERRLSLENYNIFEARVMGYIAERLFGIYYSRLKRDPDVRTLEMNKSLFLDTEPKLIIRPVAADAVPVVLAANNDFSPYLDVTIRSIALCGDMKRTYDIIILCNEITPDNRKRICTAENDPNISIRFFPAGKLLRGHELFLDQHLSAETYYRLAIPELMPGYERIIYLDCDLVVKKDIAGLFDLDIKDAVIGAVRDIDVAGQGGCGMNDWKEYAGEKLGLSDIYSYFQAGVLIIDLKKLREYTTSEKMLSLAASDSFRCHDQDVLNILFKGRVFYLPQKWNVLMDWREPLEGRSRMQIMSKAPRWLFLEYMEARKDPFIVHYAGYQKPWDVADCDMADDFWQVAKASPFYPVLLHRIKRVFLGERNPSPSHANETREPLFWRMVRFFLPVGSKRRAVAQRLWHRMKDRRERQ